MIGITLSNLFVGFALVAIHQPMMIILIGTHNISRSTLISSPVTSHPCQSRISGDSALCNLDFTRRELEEMASEVYDAKDPDIETELYDEHEQDDNDSADEYILTYAVM